MKIWFGDWLSIQVGSIVKASHPAVSCPSPLKIMSTLINDVTEFDTQAEVTRDFLKLRPDMFAEAIWSRDSTNWLPAPPALAAALPSQDAAPPARHSRAKRERKRAA